ncbi:J domain-containing protein [Magnetospira sp. QH-2]|uniref:J domain-containing protein n=1 Tax=Magnetospira sp. (strain QH-2) TaxID=1288970 RepID=UPI0003E8171C|nr:J domain-containing protein [Magnetospira sp. QH-2]CCQ72938.1 putative chaperone protein DnaJ [Magnetospira sp. QH-2]
MAGRRRKSDGRFYEPGDPDVPLCEWPDCKGEGLYRAPKSRDNIHDYRWFCLDHVREYNASWNYYAGMNENQVEADLRRDTIWDRPTWRWGAGPKVKSNPTIENIEDPFGFFRDDEPEEEIKRPMRGSPEAAALEELNLTPPLTLEVLRARYKELVKRHHPDANQGNKDSEERFKRINAAYQTLMGSIT